MYQKTLWYTPDVGHIGAPLQILGDCVKVHKKSREKQHWNSCDGSNKCGNLYMDIEDRIIL